MTKKEKLLRVVVCDGDITYSISLRPDAAPHAISRLTALCNTVRDMVVHHVDSEEE